MGLCWSASKCVRGRNGEEFWSLRVGLVGYGGCALFAGRTIAIVSLGGAWVLIGGCFACRGEKGEGGAGVGWLGFGEKF